MMYRHFLLFLILLFCACETNKSSDKALPEVSNHDYSLSYTVEQAPEWTHLFYRKSGWFAADGIFSIPLSGVDKQGNVGNTETLLIFGDTYIGEVENNKPLPGNLMVNNTVAYLNGNKPNTDNLSFHYKIGKEGSPETFFIPNNENSDPDQYFWCGDGFANQELDYTTYIFAYHIIMTGPNVFDFEEQNVSLIALPKGSRPPFENHRQIVTPLRVNNPKLGEGNFGSGILVNTKKAGAPDPDGYVYVYGCIGKDKNMVSSRVKPKDFEDFDEWRYWDGADWSQNIRDVVPIATAVSNELSVSPLPDGRFIAIFQIFGISDKVGMMIGSSPIGPFGKIEEIYTTPEYEEGLLPYNAKAHFNLSEPGELLISYNTITLDFWKDIQEDAHIYRPRFIKLKFDLSQF
jgi:hypothetical protein